MAGLADALVRREVDVPAAEGVAVACSFWARLTGARGKIKDAGALAKRAIEQGVAFVPGAPFYCSKSDGSTLRLSFATADAGKILEGVGRLAEAF